MSQKSVSRSMKVILIACLIASEVVLARFLAIRTPIISIGFSFVPLMLAGMMLGWKASTLVAVLADLIGALLFPSGAFFVGYTLTAGLTGLLAGLLLYRPDGIRIDRRFLISLGIYVLLSTAVLHGGLNTLWIMITTGGASNVIVPVRIAKQLIMAPIEFLTMLALARFFGARINQLLFPKGPKTAKSTSAPSETTIAND